MRLKRATFRHIEAEICEYHNTLAHMKAIRRDIIESSKNQELGMPAAASAGVSGVERRATKLADSILLREMERITDAIVTAYSAATEQCRQVVWIRYGLTLEGWYPPRQWEKASAGRAGLGMPVEEMCKVLSVDEATYHRYRNGFVYDVALRLGWY